MESELKKKNSLLQNEIDSLQGEFQVKMQMIRLKEMETENKRIEFLEKNEAMDIERAILQKQLKHATI